MPYSTPFWANWAEMQLFPRFTLLYALANSFVLIFPRLPLFTIPALILLPKSF